MGKYVDELQKVLNEKEKKPTSRGFGEGSGERGTFVYNKEKKCLEKYVPKKKFNANAPYVKRDEVIDGIESPLTGKKYHSKSALRREYKEHGYVETGGEHLTGKAPPPYKPDPRELKETVEKAYNDIKYGNVPIDERSRAIYEKEEREWKDYLEKQK